MRFGLAAFLVILASIGTCPAADPPGAAVPFQWHHGLIWIEVDVPEAAAPLRFLLDSGAGRSVVHLPTARRLGLQLGRPVTVRGVGGLVTGHWPQRLSATAAGLALPAEYLAVDLAHLGEACGQGVDGLLGADFFRERVVQVDWAARQIRVSRNCTAPAAATVLKLKQRRGALLVSAQVDRHAAQWLRVDTGCTAALHWVAPAASGPLSAAAPTASVGLAEMLVPTHTTTLRLGSTEFASLPTGIHHAPLFPGESGLLGTALLRHFERVTFDLRAGRLVLERTLPPR